MYVFCFDAYLSALGGVDPWILTIFPGRKEPWILPTYGIDWKYQTSLIKDFLNYYYLLFLPDL